MRDRIFITTLDAQLLRRLIAGRRAADSAEQPYLDLLEQELDRAELVAPHRLPPSVVTMNSQVTLEDLDTGATHIYRLIFPHQPRETRDVSILAPIGTAILGYRVGDLIEWPVPKGVKRLRILAVERQLAAAR